MDVESVLVTGANRGIGLEFVKQLIGLPKPPKYVFATYRSKDTMQELETVKNSSHTSQVVLIQMDITKADDLETARKLIEDRVKEIGLTLLINNAAAMRLVGFPQVTSENLNFHFTTNTVGPVMVLKEMLPLLQTSAARKDSGMSVSRSVVLNISSAGGSCSRIETQPKHWLAGLGYRTSKAALNMAMRVAALTVKEQGILVVQMCPGWVKTDMGTDQAAITTEESVSSMLHTLPKLDESNAGAFLDRDGNTIPF